jgi:hypothetical protein
LTHYEVVLLGLLLGLVTGQKDEMSGREMEEHLNPAIKTSHGPTVHMTQS